jgi:class 3 adenylate cyclase
MISTYQATIMFADLVGFTAWSSVREPTQVFTLLETIYRAYDDIARQRRVFKVETVGDCYVAVTGLPEPRKDHAVAMVKFAHDCMRKTKEVAKRLEIILGPDTADL